MSSKRTYRRRSIRLRGYDYAQPGAYFVTICTYRRQPLFGEVVDGEMRLNAAGRVARRCWLEIPQHFPHVQLDEFVIMPNHVHGILVIVEHPYPDAVDPDVGAKNVGAKNVSPLHSPDVVDPDVGAKNLSPLPSPLHPSQPSKMPRSPSRTIGSVVRGFKIGVTKWFRQNTDIYNVWQRNYYEHIIRNERALNNIRRYIRDNPLRWFLDRYNPDAVGEDPLARDIWLLLRDPKPSQRKYESPISSCETTSSSSGCGDARKRVEKTIGEGER